MNGYINFYKPRGMSSSRAVVLIRKRLPRGVKIGHAGTLDPDAQGVLPLMIGKATRFFDYMVDKEKQYRCTLRLGAKTDTQDDSGKVIETARADVSTEALEALLPRFTGDIQQIPPAFSALKVDGQPLYKQARLGNMIEKPARTVHVEAIEIVERQSGEAFVLRIRCGKGTYIRTLCNDIGDALGCFGHMADLYRERAGVFSIEAALSEDELPDLETITKHILPMDAPLMGLPRADIDHRWEKRLRAGNLLRAWFPPELPDDIYRLYLGEAFCGLIRLEGEKAKFAANILE